MKKTLLVIVLLLLLGAMYLGYKKLAKKSAEVATNTAKTVQKSVFGSIQEALSKSLTLECTFSQDSDHQVTAYIKNGAIREDVVAKDPMQSGNVIVRSGKMYYWNNRKGFVMVMPSVTPTQVTQTQPSGVQPTGSTGAAPDVLGMLEKYKNNCKPAVVADSLFTPPSDVLFQDMTQMMQQQEKMMPSGVPTGMNQQEMMQQYHVTPPSSSGY